MGDHRVTGQTMDRLQGIKGLFKGHIRSTKVIKEFKKVKNPDNKVKNTEKLLKKSIFSENLRFSEMSIFLLNLHVNKRTMF